MAMSLCGARLAVPLSAAPQAQRSLAKRQRPTVAQLVIRPGAAQPAMRPSAARPITSAPERRVRTQASGEGQPEPPAPAPTPTPAPVVAAESLGLWVTVVTGIATILTIIMTVRGFISDSSNLLMSQLAANSRELMATTRELNASNSVLTTKLDSISKDVAVITTKLDALSPNIQAQQVQTAEFGRGPHPAGQW